MTWYVLQHKPAQGDRAGATMSFLAPLFLLGGLGLALPILFHLIRRTSRVRTVFGSIMFLRAGPPRMTRRNRIEDLLLLLLRCLVLALLALAFARPFFKSPAAGLPPAAAGSRVMVLLDSSASMRREGLWSEALDRLTAVAAGLRPGDRLALWTFDRGIREVFGFEAWDGVGVAERRSWLRARLDGIQPGWKDSWLDQAFIEAADALVDAGIDEAGVGRRILVISDLAEGSRLNGLQAHDWPPGVTVEFHPVAVRDPGNAGLHWVADAKAGQSREPRVARVRVENSPDSLQEQFQLGWVSSGAGEWAGAPTEAYVPAGQSRVVTVAMPDAVTGFDRLVLRGDSAPFDNILYLNPSEPRELRVVYLGTDAADDPSEPLFFLRRAFRETQHHVVSVYAVDPSDTPPGGELDSAAMVVVTGALSSAWADRVRAVALAGATVLLAPVDAAAATTHEACLDGLRMFAGEAVPGGYAMLGDLDFRHPWLVPFADARFSDFTKIRFWRYRKMDEDRLGDGRVVARFEGGDPAVVEWPAGTGRIFWIEKPAVSLTLSRFTFWVAMAALEVGDLLAPVAGAGPARGAGTLIGPDGEALEGLGVAAEPGIYRWVAGGRERRFAVNLTPAESRTAPLPLDEFESLGVPLQPAAEEPEVVAARLQRLQRVELEQRQRLWRWVLGGTLALVLWESWLAARAVRRGREVGVPSVDTEAQGARSA